MGVSTNTPIVLAIFGFYIFIGVMFGLIGSGLATSAGDVPDVPEPSGIGFLAQIFYFVAGIGFTISSIPVWANVLLFAPLSITIFYIILSYLRGTA